MPREFFDPPFEVLEPRIQTLPLVFNSPHSGRVYPPAFLEASRLDPLMLRRSEDCYVDEIFAPVVRLGAPLMRAHFPRAYVDVNREPYELDPVMFAEPLPEYVNTRSVRVAGGLGTIARLVSEDLEIYRAPLSFAEVRRRIDTLYEPYHERLGDLVERTRRRFGAALLVDCHSMPSVSPGPNRRGRKLRPDFVLGDRYGSACGSAVVDAIESALKRLGYSVARNKPYAGGYITQTYGRPEQGLHAIQLEVNRSLYVDEETLRKRGSCGRLARELCDLVAELAARLPGLMGGGHMAAE